jgi:hypothetical protein
MHSALPTLMVKSMSSYPQAAPTSRMQYPYQYPYQPEADMRCQHSSSYLSHTYTERDKRARLLYLISQVVANY